MSDGLAQKIEHRLMEETAANDMELSAAHERAMTETNSYNLLAKLVVSEAIDVKRWIIRRNEKQQRGWLIGDVTFRRSQPELSLTSGTPYEGSLVYYVGVESPPVDSTSDENNVYGWTFELREEQSDAPRAFFSEVDANRSDHYWAKYGSSSVYVSRVASNLTDPTIAERELWYTVSTDLSEPLVISELEVDEEYAGRFHQHFYGHAEERVAVDNDYPELEAIRQRAHEEIGPFKGEGEEAFTHSLRATFRINELEEEFDKTPRGAERLKRLEEIEQRRQIEEKAKGPYYRAGTEALYHCLGLIALVKKELKIKS